MNPSSYNLYSLLNILKTATPDEIKKAYKKAALKAHPDKGERKDDGGRWLAGAIPKRAKRF